jgi:F-type H+-transporting ATPase subunit c
VSKFTTFVGAFAFALLSASSVMAQDSAGGFDKSWVGLAGPLGAGLVVIGAAYGIGRLAGFALESMARQPEVAGNIQTAMIISAALIEGFTFYALFICSTAIPPLS